MITQLKPPIPVITPKGAALAHFLIDDGPESDLKWVCFIDSNGECWTYRNRWIRADKNITQGREYISPFYNPDDVAFKKEDDEDQLKIKSVVLCRINCRENVGSIFRLCYQFGIQKIYSYKSVRPGKTDTYKAERHIEIEHVDSLDFLEELECKKIALETNGCDSEYLKNSFIKNSFILGIGNESHGFTEEELDYFDITVSLNSCVRDSYNVSHALAIGLYMIEFGSTRK